MVSMTTAPRNPTVRVVTASIALLGAVALLTGCTSSGSPKPTSSPAASASHAATTEPTAGSSASTPSPTATGDSLTSVPLALACSDLVPDSTITASYPGMTAVKIPVAPKKTDAAVIVAHDGTVCAWKGSDGKTMTLAVGQFVPDSLTRLKNTLITTSNPVPTYKVEGYFQLSGSTGTADAFPDPYWVVAISTSFAEPGDAEPLVDAAVTSLTTAD
jgi:hypothetical protein